MSFSPQVTGTTAGDDRQTGVSSYPSLWRMWNSRCVVSLTGQTGADEVPTGGGPTKELIRGSPLPIRARDDYLLPELDVAPAPPPPGSTRKFTMDQFQREFGPCLTYSAPASPLHKRFSVETIPLHSPAAHPSRGTRKFTSCLNCEKSAGGVELFGGRSPTKIVM